MIPIRALLATLALGLCAAAPAAAQDARALRIGLVTYLSGPGAGPYGMPTRNAAELLFEALNAGEVPAPHQKRGFGGTPVEMVLLDEAGTTSNVVTQYRNLVTQRNVDMVIGYISSGSCLAVAPVAEELKTLTVFYNCGTSRLFEESSFRYVFRTASHATMDSVAAAMYVKQALPHVTRYAGMNQNYAWGLDSWRDFQGSMSKLLPGSEAVNSQMPKLFAGQYGTEISALGASRPEVIHSSLWGGDLEAFLLQATPRALFAKAAPILVVGESEIYRLAATIPDGAIIGARGPHGVFAPDNALNRWFKAAYAKKHGQVPVFPSYHIVQAILGAKAAYEKAQGAGNRVPSTEDIAAAFERLSYETPSGTTRMTLGKGHRGIQDAVYGTVRNSGGKATVTNVIRFPADTVNPPDGVKSEDWVRSGLGR
ncbi:MAG: ABC transporter substrate-binding protein [Betaproteobacteria bacterium]|nr:ABC transporter substrate-binding protein [Betaproteobacteria bacterium]